MFDAEQNSGFTAGGDINISSRFTEITLLHESGNGYTHVYKAKRFGQWHVLKCLTPEASKEVQYQTLLEKEFRIAYPLAHLNIVRTLGMEDVPGLGTCIIQEYIDSEPCSVITREQAINLCDAVAYLHKSGVIHRDIKPENILIRKDNHRAVLIDFGLADKADFSVLKGSAGTTGFAAPEQWRGDVTPLVDIYGIGGVLMSNKQLRRVAAKCRQDDPQKRYQSAEAVKKVLLYRFPWFVVSAVAVILMLGGWSGYTYQMSRQGRDGQQQEIQTLREDNVRLTETIDSLVNSNEQLNSNLKELDGDYSNFKRSAEERQRSLERELEREHDANVRLQHEVNPLGTIQSSRPSAEDQRY